MIWSGVTCVDHPQLRKGLSGAVHCHVKKWHGLDEPRIIIQGSDGNEYYVVPAKIKDDTADKIKAKWELEFVPPIRRDVGISEEIRVMPVQPVYITEYRRPFVQAAVVAAGSC